MFAEDANNWARTVGLMHMLSLPPLRREDGSWHRPSIEILRSDGSWVPIDMIVIDADGIMFSYGTNGSRVEYKYTDRKCPAWRTVRR